jgi:hypothetical protein
MSSCHAPHSNSDCSQGHSTICKSSAHCHSCTLAHTVTSTVRTSGCENGAEAPPWQPQTKRRRSCSPTNIPESHTYPTHLTQRPACMLPAASAANQHAGAHARFLNSPSNQTTALNPMAAQHRPYEGQNPCENYARDTAQTPRRCQCSNTGGLWMGTCNSRAQGKARLLLNVV